MKTMAMLEEIKKLQAISEVGLLYGNNEYDRERYTELKEMSLRWLAALSDFTFEEWKTSLPLPIDYPTAKVDIRGMVISSDEKILLVKETSDGKWALPGGWADVGYSPKEVIIKEINEETGLVCDVVRLLAIFDKRKHPHPPQALYVYKFLFYCKAISSTLQKGFDLLDVGYFAIDNLPPLSEDRILKPQIELGYNKILRQDKETYFE